MFHLEIVFFIATCVCVTGVYSSLECDNNAEECIEPIINFRQDLGIHDKSKYYIHWINASQLNQICLYGERVIRCLQNSIGCVTAHRDFYQGLLDSLNFLCLETLDEYMSHGSCYAKPVVVNGLEQCAKEINTDIKERGVKEQLCGIAKYDYNCIRKEVEGECGKEAADWLVTYTKKSLTPMLDEIGCFNVSMWIVYVIGIGAGLVVVVLTTKACIMLFACVKRKKKIKEDDKANHFPNVLSQTPPANKNNSSIV